MAQGLASTLTSSAGTRPTLSSRVQAALARFAAAYVAWRTRAARRELSRHGIFVTDTEIVLADYRRIALTNNPLPFSH